ncbi:MAG: ImmA/IrrE family metallo-endopeptidase [Coriobacteriales bacterium]|jgi:hypothetical protein|nr:ImmA/IrrE family metallo-endopeptidase [Coriobacteriales bacterium]
MRIDNRRCEEIKRIIVEFLEDYEAVDYPLDLFRVFTRIGLPLIRYSDLPEGIKAILVSVYEDAFAITQHSPKGLQAIVFYNDMQPETRMRFSLAHELAHIILEHRGETPQLEREANYFAAYILAPHPLIMLWCKPDSMEIMERFHVGFECARAANDSTRKRVQFGGSKLTDYESTLLQIVAGGENYEFAYCCFSQ